MKVFEIENCNHYFHCKLFIDLSLEIIFVPVTQILKARKPAVVKKTPIKKIEKVSPLAAKIAKAREDLAQRQALTNGVKRKPVVSGQDLEDVIDTTKIVKLEPKKTSVPVKTYSRTSKNEVFIADLSASKTKIEGPGTTQRQSKTSRSKNSEDEKPCFKPSADEQSLFEPRLSFKLETNFHLVEEDLKPTSSTFNFFECSDLDVSDSDCSDFECDSSSDESHSSFIEVPALKTITFTIMSQPSTANHQQSGSVDTSELDVSDSEDEADDAPTSSTNDSQDPSPCDDDDFADIPFEMREFLGETADNTDSNPTQCDEDDMIDIQAEMQQFLEKSKTTKTKSLSKSTEVAIELPTKARTQKKALKPAKNPIAHASVATTSEELRQNPAQLSMSTTSTKTCTPALKKIVFLDVLPMDGKLKKARTYKRKADSEVKQAAPKKLKKFDAKN